MDWIDHAVWTNWRKELVAMKHGRRVHFIKWMACLSQFEFEFELINYVKRYAGLQLK